MLRFLLLLLIYMPLSTIGYIVLQNNVFIVDLCHRQQCILYVPVFESNYIPTNSHAFHTLHMNAALKQENVRLFMDFYRRTVWLNR